MNYDADHAYLAELVYDIKARYGNYRGDEGKSFVSPVTGKTWTLVLASDENLLGYQGALFQNDKGEYVFASRGTEFTHANDWLAKDVLQNPVPTRVAYEVVR